MRNTYSEIKSQLETDSITPVLFTGTPCQVAGLKFFLNKEYSNLICIDFICHGVPSSLLLKKYIGWLQEKIGSPITDYLFRSKVKGWNYNGRMVSYVSANNRYWPSVRDPYLTCFLRAYNYRESCYRCEFNSKFKFADFTVGDFAGCREKYPSFFDRKGCSVVLVNTQKGLVYFDRYRGLFDYIEITLNDVIKFNPNLNSPCTRPKERDKIYESILQYSDQEYVEKKLMCYLNGKDTINFYLPVKFKEFLKKLLHI